MIFLAVIDAGLSQAGNTALEVSVGSQQYASDVESYVSSAAQVPRAFKTPSVCSTWLGAYAEPSRGPREAVASEGHLLVAGDPVGQCPG